MMLLCLAVAAEEKLDNQATEIHAVREGEDRALCTQISGNKEKSSAWLCLFKVCNTLFKVSYVIPTIRMKSIS